MGLTRQSATPSMTEDEARHRRRTNLAFVAGATAALLASAAGGAVLLLWALQYHRSREREWMVPVGLVLFGTPVLIWFSVSASEIKHRLERLRMAQAAATSAAA